MSLTEIIDLRLYNGGVLFEEPLLLPPPNYFPWKVVDIECPLGIDRTELPQGQYQAGFDQRKIKVMGPELQRSLSKDITQINEASHEILGHIESAENNPEKIDWKFFIQNRFKIKRIIRRWDPKKNPVYRYLIHDTGNPMTLLQAGLIYYKDIRSEQCGSVIDNLKSGYRKLIAFADLYQALLVNFSSSEVMYVNLTQEAQLMKMISSQTAKLPDDPELAKILVPSGTLAWVLMELCSNVESIGTQQNKSGTETGFNYSYGPVRLSQDQFGMQMLVWDKLGGWPTLKRTSDKRIMRMVTTRQGGTAEGLNIVDRVVEAMAGEIVTGDLITAGVNGEMTKGVYFKVVIPLSRVS